MEIEGIGAVAKEKKAVRWLRKYIPECPSFYRHEDDRTSLINWKSVISKQQKNGEEMHTTQKKNEEQPT